MYCCKCGSKNAENARFCLACGCRLASNTQSAKKEKSGYKWFSYIALIASFGSSLFPLCYVANYFIKTDLVIILAVVGFLLFIPAAVLSVTAFAAALIKHRTGNEYAADFRKRIAALFLSIILPVLVLASVYVFNEPIVYDQAVKAFESRDYLQAGEQFDKIPDYQDSSVMADECDYLLAAQYASRKEWNEARKLLEPLAQKDYKASRELYMYCHTWIQAEIRTNMAENDLVSMLKDPVSYVATRKSWTYTISERGPDAHDLHLVIKIQYSAKNSFGGRVTELYEREYDVVLSDDYGFSSSEIDDLLKSSIHKITSAYAPTVPNSGTSADGTAAQNSYSRIRPLVWTVSAVLVIVAVILAPWKKKKKIVREAPLPEPEREEKKEPEPIIPEKPAPEPAPQNIGRCVSCGKDNIPVQTIEVIVAGKSRKRTMCDTCAAKYL